MVAQTERDKTMLREAFSYIVNLAMIVMAAGCIAVIVTVALYIVSGHGAA